MTLPYMFSIAIGAIISDDLSPSLRGPCKLIWDYGITVEKLGLWDYTLFEIGITEIMFEIGITGLQDYTSFQIGIVSHHLPQVDCHKIGITGLQPF